MIAAGPGDPGTNGSRGPLTGQLASWTGWAGWTPAGPMLERLRLHELMDRSVQYPVTVISAPAGSGKTQLLASWLAAAGHRAAWVTVRRDGNRPDVFWPELLAAVEPAGQPAPARNDPVGQFRQAAGRLESPLLLVVDDIHELTDANVVDGFGEVLANCPPRLKVILSGRGERLPLARLRVAGQVTDLRFSDLVCTTAEAHSFFRLAGIETTDREIATVVDRTEGWLGGLRLAAMWWHAQPPKRRDFGEFSGSARIVADYLDDEVLRGLSPATVRFLLRTCVVEKLTGELADALTGDQGGGRVLDRLDRENAMVAAVDARRRWFRFHPLLRDHLRARLLRETPEQLQRLLTRAAQWYAEAGMTLEALRCAEEAKNWELTAQILVADGHRTVDAADSRRSDQLLDRLLGRLPPSYVTGDARVAAVYARARLRAADPDGAERYLRVTERLARGSWGGPIEHLVHALRRNELRLLQGCLRGEIDADDIRAAQETLARAADIDEHAPVHPSVAATAFQLGLAQLWNGDLLGARDALTIALVEKAPALTSRERAWAAAVAAAEGRLRAAEQLLAGVDLAADTETGRAFERALTDFTQALICLERDRLGDAWRLLNASSFQALQAGDPPVVQSAALCRARLLTLWGDHQGARNELQLARSDGAAGLPGRYAHVADVFEAQLLAQEGDIDQARRKLETAVATTEVAGLAFDAVALGRLHLATGEPTSALDAVAPCLDNETTETRLLDIVGAHLVAAGAHRLLTEPAAAREHVEQALSLADGDGLVRVFIEGGRAVRSVLTVMVAPDGPYGPARSKVLRHFETQPKRRSKGRQQQVALTTSELAVLRYLPSHLTNDEIAEDLCLSVNTVKSHLRSLYRKLNVAHRREAIARARQLGLLQ